MFNFLNHNKIDKQEEEPIEKAAIIYKVLGDGGVSVDVNLEDFDKESMSALFMILDLISMDSCYLQTLQIVKDGLESSNQKQCLELLYQHISSQVSQKVISSINEAKKDQPCIQPLGMLK